MYLYLSLCLLLCSAVYVDPLSLFYLSVCVSFFLSIRYHLSLSNTLLLPPSNTFLTRVVFPQGAGGAPPPQNAKYSHGKP
jgi:hypothetical protein